MFGRRWTNYRLLAKLSERPEEIQVAMFENCLGDDAMKIYQSMQFETAELKQTIQEIIDALEKYAIGVTNETNELFWFGRKSRTRVKLDFF